MAIPILGSVLGGVVGGTTGTVTGGFIGSLLAPDILAQRYKAFQQFPVLIPQIEQVFDAWLRGHLSSDKAEKQLKALGVNLTPPFETPECGVCDNSWLSAFFARRPRLNPADLLRLKQRGFFSKEEDFLAQWCWTGADIADWEAFRKSGYWSLTPIDYVRFYLRDKVLVEGEPKAEIPLDEVLRRAGLASASDRGIARELVEKQYPSVSDLERYMVRDVFDLDAAKARGLAKEFPALLKKFAKVLGFDWDIGEKTEIDGKLVPLTWMLCEWMAHWQPISPTLAREMQFRLRGDPKDENTWRVKGVKPWTHADSIRVLKIADYPEAEREQIAATFVALPGLRQIRDQHFQGVVPEDAGDKGKKALIEMYRDLGYSPETADAEAETTIRRNAKRRGREILGMTRAMIAGAVELGYLGQEVAEMLLREIGLDAKEAKAAYQAMQLGVTVKMLKKMVAGIRKNYLLGDYTATETHSALVAAGITTTRATQYLQVWDQEQRQFRLERAPAILTRWLILGTIDVGEIRRRLSTIGYPNSEIDRIIAAAIFAQKKQPPPDTLVPKGKGGRGGQAKAKELSETRIQAMLERNIITQDEAVAQLLGQGYDPEDVERLLALWSAPPGP